VGAVPIGPAHHQRENDLVSGIFITGSTDGLGRAAAGVLVGEGHDMDGAAELA
jgi:NADP-dependent 3-hydroxy acid dehydrogenase YdfG